MKPTVIITGAGSGIGRALAIELVIRDCQVIGVGRRLKALEETRSFNPERIQVSNTDLSRTSEWNQLISMAESAKKPVYLVHCASNIEPISPIVNITYNRWRKNLEINLEAPFFLTQSLLPYLKGGRVLFITSIYAHKPVTGLSVFCICKSALFMLYRCFSEELKEQGIFFGTAMPGNVDTSLQEKIRNNDEKVIPSVKTFRELKMQDRLLPPRIAANFLAYVLLDTDNIAFSTTEWNIDDRNHIDKWYK